LGTVTFSKAYALSTNGTYTLTSGDLILNGFDLTTGIFSSSGAVSRSITFGTNNIILAHTTGSTVVLNMTDVTNFTWVGTGGFTTAMTVARGFIFGTTGGSTTNAPNLSLTSGAGEALITTASWFNTFNCTGSTSIISGALTASSTNLNLNGLTLSSGVVSYASLSVTMRGTGTITPNAKTIASFTVNGAGTTTFAGPLGCTSYTQTAGDVNFATFNLTCSSSATYAAGTLSNVGTISCTTYAVNGSLTLASGSITCSSNFTNNNIFIEVILMKLFYIDTSLR
jgi:hypothetical protein